jgi:hypothetical protein
VGFEEFAELASGLASACLAVLPLMRVDAQRRVGLAMAEPPLDLDEGNVDRDQSRR